MVDDLRIGYEEDRAAEAPQGCAEVDVLQVHEVALVEQHDAFGIGAPLEVVGMEGWARDLYADATGLPWVMPSPNMPTLDTAIVYPGTVLFEGTLLSEGRGTTRPFELVGAPWIDPERFAADLNALQLPGVHFRPAGFEPTFQKHARQPCGGCQIHVTDRDRFRPVLTGVALLATVLTALLPAVPAAAISSTAVWTSAQVHVRYFRLPPSW